LILLQYVVLTDYLFILYNFFAYEFSNFHGFLNLIIYNSQFLSLNFFKIILSVSTYLAVWFDQIHEFLINLYLVHAHWFLFLIVIHQVSLQNFEECVSHQQMVHIVCLRNLCIILWIVLKGMNLISCGMYETFFCTEG
jgi:hypothetical protein